MAFLKRQSKSIIFSRQGVQSNPETLSRTSDFEPDTIVDFTNLAALGMWSYPTSHEHCCIYRVPHRLRRIKPEAYTPQLVLIGPLHHYLKKSQALQSREEILNTELMGYLNMEEHKKIYLAEFSKRFHGKETIDGFRSIIKENEERIRLSYSESTSWINSPDFVKMILLDSVFILEYILKMTEPRNVERGDIIMDEPCLYVTVREDLLLLENQLPYFILEKLYASVFPQPNLNQTLRKLIILYFEFEDNITEASTFSHFTDLLRRVRVNTLGSKEKSKTIFRHLSSPWRYLRKKILGSPKSPKMTIIKHMYNAEKLHSAGVTFKVIENEFSIDVRFENGCLKIPSLWVVDDTELILRNIMALEQCHYPFTPYVCNFVNFLDFLIDNSKDVDLLTEKGILHNWIGEQKLVADMVNKLCLGIIFAESNYFDTAEKVNAYYDNPINKTRAVLDRMYFSNLWRGTATVAAILLLVMTLIQTVVSVIQFMQK